jgi:hypothetical protein
MDIDCRAMLSRRIRLSAGIDLSVMIKIFRNMCPLDAAHRVQSYFNISALAFQADERFSVDPVRSISQGRRAERVL